MKKHLLIGQSGSGKSHCALALQGRWRSVDMDQIADLGTNPSNRDLLALVQSTPADLIAVSVLPQFLRFLVALRSSGDLDPDLVFIYLRTSDRSKHLERLQMPPAVGKPRTARAIEVIMRWAERIDAICSALADHVIEIDDISADDTVAAIAAVLDSTASSPQSPAPDFLTRSDYDEVARSIGGKHWSGAEHRWGYHALAAEWAKELGLSSAGEVLELGTMGVQIVKGSDTIDYTANQNNPDWHIEGYTPTYLHDLRTLPWPVADQSYKLVIALRVFHHLRPVQHYAFLEAKRIGAAFIIVVPPKDVDPTGINREEMVAWNNGVEPLKEQRFPGQLGGAYFWRW